MAARPPGCTRVCLPARRGDSRCSGGAGDGVRPRLHRFAFRPGKDRLGRRVAISAFARTPRDRFERAARRTCDADAPFPAPAGLRTSLRLVRAFPDPQGSSLRSQSPSSVALALVATLLTSRRPPATPRRPMFATQTYHVHSSPFHLALPPLERAASAARHRCYHGRNRPSPEYPRVSTGIASGR